MFPKSKRIENRKLLDTYHKMRCVVCNSIGQTVAHHVKTKKTGGHDIPSNLMPLDFKHHTEVHAIGLIRFAEKYTSVKLWLLSNGWKLNEYKMKWEHEQ